MKHAIDAAPPRKTLARIWTALLCACALVTAAACTEDAAPVSTTDVSALLDDGAFAASLADGDGEDLSDSLSGVAESLAAEEDVDFAMGLDGDEEDGFANDCRIELFRERVFAHYDIDEDGALSPDEARGLRHAFGAKPLHRHRFARHHRLARLRWIYDADDSGELSDAERDDLRMDLETRCMNRRSRLLEHWDDDGSGDLDADEWAAARTALHERKRARREAFIDAHDEDDDGRLDLLERLNAIADRIQRILERRAAAVLEFDTDGDGALDTEERLPLRERLRARVRGEQWTDDAPEEGESGAASIMLN